MMVTVLFLAGARLLPFTDPDDLVAAEVEFLIPAFLAEGGASDFLAKLLLLLLLWLLGGASPRDFLAPAWEVLGFGTVDLCEGRIRASPGVRDIIYK